ncbi:E3 ubiquitin-protein ligase RNF182-like [Apteryx mantelli]|uniref:E3 ubiquitin-protein ligase RNF182 n=1 Tax=Apteryx mantelli TaxID=2696672 RepID=A0ABM4FGD5_9AVES
MLAASVRLGWLCSVAGQRAPHLSVGRAQPPAPRLPPASAKRLRPRGLGHGPTRRGCTAGDQPPARLPVASHRGAPAWTAARPPWTGPRAASPAQTMTHKDGELESSQPLVFTAHELECKICYHRYDARARKPKLLSCGHRVCAKCLRRMVALGDASPRRLSCPFCRRETPVPGEDVQRLQDDSKVLAVLTYHERAKKRGASLSPEVILCPSVLEPFAEPSPSSDCLVITILEVPEDLAPPEGLGVLDMIRLYRPASLGALPCHGPMRKCRSWTWQAVPHFILGMLCLIYFSSLPFGIYLLLIEHHSLGIVLVSLVPSTLLLCIFYSCCQCLCREVFAFPSP